MALSDQRRQDIRRIQVLLWWAEKLLKWLVEHGLRKSPAQSALLETQPTNTAYRLIRGGRF